jgi:hypothetical protein
MKKVISIGIIFCVFLVACNSIKEIDTRWARGINACEKLEGKTVVYTIFVDSKTSLFWTGFDIKSTKDSLQKVFDWTIKQAAENGKTIEIIPEYYSAGSQYSVKKKLPYPKVSDAFKKEEAKDQSKFNKWAESIVKKVEKSVKLNSGQKLSAKPRLKGFAKLEAKLKRKHNADNVAIFFMLNNYFLIDANAVFNSMTDEQVEFAINSGKKSSRLASQFLTLFGAQPLTSGKNSQYKIKNVELAKVDFPNDIMVSPEKDLNQLNIGQFTAFMLGWQEKVEPQHVDFFKVKLKKKKDENE